MTQCETDFTTPTTEPLEQRIPRLSISIGVRISSVANPQEREMVLADALIEVLEDLIRRGLPIGEAAPMADDIIAAARIVAARLMAWESAQHLASASD